MAKQAVHVTTVRFTYTVQQPLQPFRADFKNRWIYTSVPPKRAERQFYLYRRKATLSDRKIFICITCGKHIFRQIFMKFDVLCSCGEHR